MGNDEYTPASEPLHEAMEAIMRHGQLHGMPYTNIVLSGEGLADTLDPDHSAEVDYAAFYWPGGNPESASRFELLAVTQPDEQYGRHDVQAIRQRLLSLSVGQAALSRIPLEINEYRRDISNHGGDPVADTHNLCVLTGVPLSMVQLRTVIRGRLIAPGSTLAALYHPLPIPPRPALRALQRAVRQVIASEQL